MNPNKPKLHEINPKSMSSAEIERWLRSVQADLEEPGVFVPEMNSIRWDWDAEENKDKPTFAFLIPVAYRGSIANLGINILHEEMNRYRNQICERIYFPYPKLFRRLIKNNIPLFSNESFHQAKDFEVLGISSYYPLQFLAFPRLLKMSGMEPLSKDRKEEDPIVMFGGVAAFNPAPVADFVDVVNLGDGEGVLADAVQMVHDLRKVGKSKYDILVELQKKVPGVYVPALYKEEYYPKDDPHRPNQFKAHVPLRDDIPERIKKVTCEIRDVRPVSKIIQPNSLGDDMSSGAVEITRGCFAAGTQVITATGKQPIEKVKAGTKVLSFLHDGTQKFSISEGAVQTRVAETFIYKTKSAKVCCTSNHKFLTRDLTWHEAQEVFEQGLTLYHVNETFIEREEAGVQPVYDMTVVDTHCYVADGFVVHNCGHKSFVKGTPVSTNHGLVPIEQVTSNDLVLVENGDGTREFVAQRGAFCTGTKQVARFAIPGTNKQFICTSDHRFAVKNFDGSEGLTSYVEAGHISENPNNLDYSLYVPNVSIGEFDRGAYDAGLAINSSQSLELSVDNVASFVLGLMRSCFTTNVDRAGYLIGASFDLLSEQAKNAIANALTICGIRWEEGTASIVVLRTDLHKLVSIQNAYASEVTPVQQFNVYDESPALYLEKIEDLGEQEVWDLETSVHNFYANGTLVHNCSFCFDEDTMIATSKGLKRIADITSDDAIVSLDENGNRCLSKTDGAVLVGEQEVHEFKATNTSVVCTPDHKFLTDTKNYVPAKQIASAGVELYQPKFEHHPFDREAYLVAVIGSDFALTEKTRYPTIGQLKGRPCIEYLASLKLHNTEWFGAEKNGAIEHRLRYTDGYMLNLARRVFGRCYSREKDPKYELTPETANSFIFGMLSTDCALRKNAKGPQLIFNSLSEKWIYFIASALTMSGIKYLLDKKHDRYTCSVSSLFEIKKLKQIADSFKDIYVVDIEWPTLEPKYQRKKMNVAHPSLGVRKVYDLTVYDTHCYFANGFAVHNCEGSFRSMPYRERNLDDIYKAIDDTLLDSGSSSLTPYAFNLSDHHRIFDILQYAMTKWPTRIGMSSQHINHFSEQMADMALMTGTRSITIALESADPVMRRRIGKTLTDETVERVFRLIIRKGFTSIKVYMISNLPMEDDESLHEIENFSRKLIRWQIEEQSPNFASKEEAHAYVSRPEFDEEIDKFAASCKLAFRNKTKIIPEGEEYWNLHLKYKLTTRIKFSYTSFNGKAHTPMQWAQVLPLDEEGFPSIRRDMHTIFDVIQACGHSFRMSGDLEISTLNQVLSYADRRFSQVLIDLCNDERFNYMGTLVAGSNNTMKDFADLMAGRGFDFKFFYREKELDEPFPWDFINMGVTRAYLEKRWQMYKSATDDIRCQEECTKCGGCTKVSRELFKRYWTEGLEEKKYQFRVTPIIKRENTCKIRFRFRMRPEYRWLYGFNKKQWLRRAFYRAGFPIRTNISLASDGIEFNNFTYGADYGEVWLYSKNFDKNNIVERLNATFDEAEPLLQFEDAMVGESASPFKEDIGSIAYSVQIPSKMYTKATLDGLIQSLLHKDEIIIKQKVASSIKRDSTETISIDVKDKLSQLFSVSDEGFTTVYFKLTYGINPYSLLVTLLNTSLARCKKFPIEVRDYLGRDNEDSFDMFAEICEECGEPIERNIFDDVIGDKYCLKCATLHEKHVLVANLDAEDTEDDSDLDDFDLSFFEDDDMADTNEELHGDE